MARLDERREVGSDFGEAVALLGLVALPVAALVDRDDVMAGRVESLCDEVPRLRVRGKAVDEQEVLAGAVPLPDRDLDFAGAYPPFGRHDITEHTLKENYRLFIAQALERLAVQ